MKYLLSLMLVLLATYPFTTQARTATAGNESATCIVPPASLAATPAPPTAGTPDNDKALISADSAEVTGADTTVFRGNVRISYRDRTVRADEATYVRRDARLQLSGNVRIESETGNFFQSGQAEMNTDLQTGSLQAGEFYFTANQSRGNAKQILFREDRSVVLESVKFTTCPRDNETWSLFFKRLALDQESDNGIGRHAVLRFHNVPVFYTPYLRFPLGNRRQSGLLIPTFGESDAAGTTVALPYYLNLAPNYDATITARWMSKRGLQSESEIRYLGERTSGDIVARYLPRDAQTGNERSYGAIQHQHQLTDRLSATLQAETVSDPDYFEDLADDSLNSSPTHLPRRLQLLYQRDRWRAEAQLLDYQVLDDTLASVDTPYRRVPQLSVYLDPQVAGNGITGSLAMQYARFEHPVNESATRINLNPTASLPIHRPWGYVTPAVNGALIGYQQRTVGADTQIGSAIFSIDSGLFFEREFVSGTGWKQTLEPRAFYVFSPYIDQSALPLFDTAEAEYNFDRLFRPNRFIGGDRIGDENRLTLALGSRWFDQLGKQRLHAGIGQSFYFQDRRVSAELPAAAAETDTVSDTLLEVSANLDERLYLRSTWSWNTVTGIAGTSRQFLQYQPDSRRIVNLGYRYQELAGESADLSTEWSLGRRWSAYTRLQYGLTSQTNLSSYAGFIYRSCCWSFQTLFSQKVDTNGKQQRAYQFQLGLTGLGGGNSYAGQLPLAQSVFFDR